MAHMIDTPSRFKKRGKDAATFVTPGPKGTAGWSPAGKNQDPLSPAETATPQGPAWGPTPSPAWGSAGSGVGEDAVQAAISMAVSGNVDDAIAHLRRRLAHTELLPARHRVLEALVGQDALKAACEVALDALRPLRAFSVAIGEDEDAESPGASIDASPSLATPGTPLAGAGSSEAGRPSTPARAAVKAKPGLLPSSVDMLLRALLQDQQHARAAELLRVLSANGGELPGDAVLNSVVDSAVRVKAFAEAWEVLELLLNAGRRADKYWVAILTKSLEQTKDRRIVRRGIALVDQFVNQQRRDVDEIVFNSLLNVLGKNGDMTRMESTLKRMQDLEVAPSAVTFGTIVKAYGAAKDFESVIRVWQEMGKRNLNMNPVTCGCVLDACVKCGHLEQAQAIFHEMKLRGLHKNTVLYATLIKGLAKAHNLFGAMNLFSEMRREEVSCNLVTYNSLMDVCVRCDNTHWAAFFLHAMMQEGIQPDLITFSTLIKGYSQTGQLQKAFELARHAKDRGLKCDEIMFNSLIDGCAKATDMPEERKLQCGLQVFADMIKERILPTNITFSILVRLYFDVGHHEDAFRIVDDMAPKYRCAPTRVVYTALLRCCAVHGGEALTRAAALLGELANKRNSKLPDQGMLGAVLAGCARHGALQLGTGVLRDFALGPAARRAPLGGLAGAALDGLKALLEAAVLQGDEQETQELIQMLRNKGLLSSSSAGQMHSAIIVARHARSGGYCGQAGLQAADSTTADERDALGGEAEAEGAAPSAYFGGYGGSAQELLGMAGYTGVGMQEYPPLLPPYMAAAGNPFAATNPFATAAAASTLAANPFAAHPGAHLGAPPYMSELYAVAAAQFGLAAQLGAAAQLAGFSAAQQPANAVHLAAQLAVLQQFAALAARSPGAAAAVTSAAFAPTWPGAASFAAMSSAAVTAAAPTTATPAQQAAMRAAATAPAPVRAPPVPQLPVQAAPRPRLPLAVTVAPAQEVVAPVTAKAATAVAPVAKASQGSATQPPRGGTGKGKGSQRTKENRRTQV